MLGETPLYKLVLALRPPHNNVVLLIAEAVLDFEDAAIGQENIIRRKTGGVSSAMNDESQSFWSDAQKPHSSGSYSQPYVGPKKLS